MSDIILAVLAVIGIYGIFFALWSIGRRALVPGRGERHLYLIELSGSAPDIEATMRGLDLLRSRGMTAEVRLVDRGLEDEALKRAALLIKERDFIHIEDGKWTKQRTP